MKRLIWTTIITTSLLLARSNCLRAQEPAPVEPTPGAGEDESKSIERARKDKALDERRAAKAADERRFAEEQEEMSAVDAIPAPPMTRGKRFGAAGGFGGVAPMAAPFSQNRMQPILTHGPGAGSKPLVIRSANADAKEEANLEEDLAVMAHIFDKSLEELPGGQPHRFKAAGIDVFFTPGQNPMRSFYLEGYGAVFLLSVSFPLVPPPQKVEREKPAVDSTWTEAQAELFGQPSDGAALAGMAEEYSEEKVGKLQDSLFESLKNATNIRGLKPDDSVTVAIFGGSSPIRTKVKAAAKRSLVAKDGDTFLWQETEAQGRQTMMTVRVKKADIDAYAKGKLNPEEFQKRAKLTAYNTGSGSPVYGGASGFGAVVGDTRF